MLTMTRLPPDSFLPSGALDHNPNNPSAQPGFSARGGGNPYANANGDVVSPLSLSRAPSQFSYFDVHPQSNNPNSTGVGASSNSQIYTPLSTGLAGYGPQQQQYSYLSPHLQPALAPYDKRSASLSPTRRATRIGGHGMHRTASAVTSPSRMPLSGFPPGTGIGIMGGGGGGPGGATNSNTNTNTNTITNSNPQANPHPQHRSVSADAATAGPSAAQVIRRLAQQNNRIRETWEAERKYLEANRERVEEVYKEERAIMEQERIAWDAERKGMEDQIIALQGIMSDLQTQNVLLSKRLELDRAGKMAGISVPLTGLRGGGAGTDGSADTGLLTTSSAQSLQRGIPGSVIGVRSDMSSSSNSGSKGISPLQNRLHFISPASSRMSPSKQPEVSPFIPLSLNHHVQPATAPAVDFLAASTLPTDPKVPSIDVQQVHPDLEGIPLRANAVKKSTFTDEDNSSASGNSKTSSRDASPPGGAAEQPGKLKRGNSKEHTLQVLSAHESDRLTMHAGHTPSHSLSQFPTAAHTETGTVVNDSGGSTPTLTIPEPAQTQDTKTEQAAGSGTGAGVDAEPRQDDHPEENFDATADDVKLTGPLMVRNIPAYDEEFFKRVNEKLENVRTGKDAVPSVLRHPLEDPDGDAAPTAPANEVEMGKDSDGQQKDSKTSEGLSLPRRDSGSDADAERSDSESRERDRDDDDEMDIPLKLKPSRNFGAPFGEI
jgi:hypothetical protein